MTEQQHMKTASLYVVIVTVSTSPISLCQYLSQTIQLKRSNGTSGAPKSFTSTISYDVTC